MIVFYVILLILGFVALVKGADLFVDGSSVLAQRVGVSSLVIGLTVVALGTSAPELAVSVVAAVRGANEIALSNVVGSNLFNLLCVLGFSALLCPVPAAPMLLRRDLPLSAAGPVLVASIVAVPLLLHGGVAGGAMTADVGVVNRPVGGILLLVFLIYMTALLVAAGGRDKAATSEPSLSPGRCALWIGVGLGLIIGGGQAVVTAAEFLARAVGISETVIGLTVVAVGTSLPELVTSVVAAKKGETALAAGNVIGSNIFNFFFILGVSALICPIAVPAASLWDLVLLVVITVVTWVFLGSGHRLTRLEGGALLMLYGADMAFVLLR